MNEAERDQRNVEARIRRLAKAAGHRLIKSPQSISVNVNNHGEYMLLDDRDRVVLGSRFDATLAGVAWYLGNM